MSIFLISIAILTGLAATLRLSALRKFRITGKARLLGLILLGGGFSLSLSATERISSIYAKRDWPIYKAKVTKAELTLGKAYRPIIQYEYEISDQAYTGSTDMRSPGFGGKKTRYDAGKSLIERFPAGTILSIHANPADPTESIYNPVPKFSMFMLAGVGAMLYLGGLCITMMLPRQKSSA